MNLPESERASPPPLLVHIIDAGSSIELPAQEELLNPEDVPLPISPVVTDSTTNEADEASVQYQNDRLASADEEEDPNERDPLARLPNIFRLLDLYQENGSGGLVEKMIIDQDSLYRFLQRICPGSYELPWKINFKLLDEFAIEPIGVYGSKSEIIKFLRDLKCLTDEGETLLTSTSSQTDGLRSGLYLVLPLKNENFQDDRTLRAYIVYWPEDTTWDDKAITSVRRNRVTFMRYLSKLTDQTIALVSVEQAAAIVWKAGAQNVDAPTAPVETYDDSRMFSFEVAVQDESEEGVIANPGFTMDLKAHGIPRLHHAKRVELVAGEEEAGLMIVYHEPAHITNDVFTEEITKMGLVATIESKAVAFQMDLKDLNQVHILGDNGLRKAYPEPFGRYKDRMKAEDEILTREQSEETQKIKEQIQQDKPRLRSYITRTVQRIYQRLYPSIDDTEPSEEIHPDDDSLLREQYITLHGLSQEIQETWDFKAINDPGFQDLKRAWCLARDFVTSESQPSKSQQQKFIQHLLDLENDDASGNGRRMAKRRSPGVWKRILDLTGISDLLNLSKNAEECEKTTDIEFVASMRALCEKFPTMVELSNPIVNSVQKYQAHLGRQVLKEVLDKVIDRETRRQLHILDRSKIERQREKSTAAVSALCEELKRLMPSVVPWVLSRSIFD
ncbi:hypothetical protein RhiJN_26852 [Ceratobasidium sp. AG-Ba]|nr:hypothetical protein RhiJN_26852 [Ceratobasidium sp. AG-Ba]